MSKHILCVVTSQQPGFHFGELAKAYSLFSQAGFIVHLASIQGGLPPCDPASLDPLTVSNISIHNPSDFFEKLQNTLPVDDLYIEEYDAIFLPGGPGCLTDCAHSAFMATLVSDAFYLNKIIGAVSHGVVGLQNAVTPEGEPLRIGEHTPRIISNPEIGSEESVSHRIIGLLQTV